MSKPLPDREWAEAWLNEGWPKIRQALIDRIYPHEQMTDPIKKVRLNTKDGPMAYLGDVIVKKMEKAGYPSYVHTCYRSPEEQQRVFAKGRSKARAFQSAHQFFEAVDIVHKSKHWQASPQYWETLANVVRTVSKEYGVELVHGHHWKFVDSAHIELADWRSVRAAQERQGPFRVPTPADLDKRLKEVLPDVWRSQQQA